MKWMRERDLLIAQTMAFVQSVTGKTPAADKLFAAPVAPVDATRPAQTPDSVEMAPAALAININAVLAEVTVIAEPPKPAPMARLNLQDDVQSEIRARVANFRAHQERFSREREAYCSATMAKVRAALDQHRDTSQPGK